MPTKTVYPLTFDSGYYKLLLAKARGENMSLAKYIEFILQQQIPYKRQTIVIDCSDDLIHYEGQQIPVEYQDWDEYQKWIESPDNQDNLNDYEPVEIRSTPRVRI